MRSLRALFLSAALLSSATFAFGQDYHASRYQDRDDRRIYQMGYDQGRSDAQHRHRFNPDSNRYREEDDRHAYRQGYEAGYNSARNGNGAWDRNRDRDNDRYGRNGGYGNSGYGGYGNAMGVARQNGLRDGENDGRKDRVTGHSYRPTQDDNYKKAPGYSSNMGDRQQYKDVYRQAYQQGYQRGYGR